jgi:hypothetical protein
MGASSSGGHVNRRPVEGLRGSGSGFRPGSPPPRYVSFPARAWLSGAWGRPGHDGKSEYNIKNGGSEENRYVLCPAICTLKSKLHNRQ